MLGRFLPADGVLEGGSDAETGDLRVPSWANDVAPCGRSPPRRPRRRRRKAFRDPLLQERRWVTLFINLLIPFDEILKVNIFVWWKIKGRLNYNQKIVTLKREFSIFYFRSLFSFLRCLYVMQLYLFFLKILQIQTSLRTL